MTSGLVQGRLLADEGMTHAAQGAGPSWMTMALSAWETTCRTHNLFSSDDVWGLDLPAAPKDNRAMGKVAVMALQRDWCEWTGEYTETERPQAHARPIRVYRSHLWTP